MNATHREGQMVRSGLMVCCSVFCDRKLSVTSIGSAFPVAFLMGET
ncbi:hypothetical protein [Acaryochloris sp. IP29b_bin.148]|nr:hypothetical protein [Acaryochloris sp. IP29b_bin.148]